MFSKTLTRIAGAWHQLYACFERFILNPILILFVYVWLGLVSLIDAVCVLVVPPIWKALRNEVWIGLLVVGLIAVLIFMSPFLVRLWWRKRCRCRTLSRALLASEMEPAPAFVFSAQDEKNTMFPGELFVKDLDTVMATVRLECTQENLNAQSIEKELKRRRKARKKRQEDHPDQLDLFLSEDTDDEPC